MLILVKAVIQGMRANAVKNSLGLAGILCGMLVDCRPEALLTVALLPPSHLSHPTRGEQRREEWNTIGT
jgi:hypothetical protein